MLKESVGNLLVRLSFPATAGMVVYSLFSLIDTFYVARLGSVPLAAVTLTIPLQILVISVCSATGTGLTSLIGRKLGAGEIGVADNIAWHGVIITIIYSAIFLWLGSRYLDWLLIMIGCSPETFALSKTYLQIILWGLLFIFMPMTLGNIIQGEGNTFLPMMISLAGIISNVILDPLFIFGWRFIPPLGLAGAAWASILSQVIITVISIEVIRRRKMTLTWLWSNFRPSWRVVVDIYRVGFPSMIMEIASVLVMAVLNRILTGFGSTSIAAMGIFMRVRSLAYMPVFGLSQGTMPIASFAYGAGSSDRVKETIIKSSTLAFFFTGAAWLVMQYHPAWVMGFFSQEAELTRAGINAMRMATIFLPVMGPIIILNTILQSVGKGFSAMWLSLARQVLFLLPLLLLLPPFLGINGVWLSFSLTELLSALLGLVFFLSLWRDLQVRPRVAVVMLFQKGYLLDRFKAWLKWS